MGQNKGSLPIHLLVLEIHLPSNLRILRVVYIESILVSGQGQDLWKKQRSEFFFVLFLLPPSHNKCLFVKTKHKHFKENT